MTPRTEWMQLHQSKSQLNPEGFVLCVFGSDIGNSPLTMRCIVARTHVAMWRRLYAGRYGRNMLSCMYRYGFLDGEGHTLDETAAQIQYAQNLSWVLSRERMRQVVVLGMRIIRSWDRERILG